MYTIYKENYNVDTNLDASVMLFRVMNPHHWLDFNILLMLSV